MSSPAWAARSTALQLLPTALAWQALHVQVLLRRRKGAAVFPWSSRPLRAFEHPSPRVPRAKDIWAFCFSTPGALKWQEKGGGLGEEAVSSVPAGFTLPSTSSAPAPPAGLFTHTGVLLHPTPLPADLPQFPTSAAPWEGNGHSEAPWGLGRRTALGFLGCRRTVPAHGALLLLLPAVETGLPLGKL